MLVIVPEGPLDGPPIERLLDAAFGLDRFRKTSYRYRPGVEPVAGLCLVAREEERLVGAIRFWPVRLGGSRCLLLGPLAIDPGRRNRGIGRALAAASLARAEALGWRIVFLVGDRAYYDRHGFGVAPPGIAMPGEDPARLLCRTLGGGSLPVAGGVILRDRPAGLLGVPPQVGDERLAHQRQALVGAGTRVHPGEPLGYGPGGARPAREDDGTRRGQAPPSLPLDPEPRPLAGVLARESHDRPALAGLE